LGFDPLRNDPFLREGPIMMLDAPFPDLPRGEPGVLRVGVEMAKRYGLAAAAIRLRISFRGPPFALRRC